MIEFTAPCYGPAQLQAAYHEQPLFDRGITGRGQTIVIVDPFGSPTIRPDLAAFDAAFGLPAPPALTIIQPAGPVPGYDPADAANWLNSVTFAAWLPMRCIPHDGSTA